MSDTCVLAHASDDAMVAQATLLTLEGAPASPAYKKGTIVTLGFPLPPPCILSKPPSPPHIHASIAITITYMTLSPPTTETPLCGGSVEDPERSEEDLSEEGHKLSSSYPSVSSVPTSSSNQCDAAPFCCINVLFTSLHVITIVHLFLASTWLRCAHVWCDDG